jgi:NifU-like protein involved in Fe-S cluster formation
VIDELYSARILTLAANMPHAGRLTAPDASSHKTAKLCGSTITVDVSLDDEGRVSAFAQDVKACALGQAAAAVLGAQIIGATPDEIDAARLSLRAMLKSEGAPPAGRFKDLIVLQPVKAFPARHASTLLAFEAASEAARNAALAAQNTQTSRTSPAVAG